MVSASINRLTNSGSKSILLYGVPGTEKVKIALHAACSLLNIDISRLMNHRYDPLGMVSDNGCWEILSMHPGYDYSSFIGLRREKAGSVNSNNNFSRGIFSSICKKAAEMRDLHGRNERSRNFVLILDGIERVKLPELLGEMMPALDFRDVAVPTVFTRSLSVPDNLYVIAIAHVGTLRMLPHFSDIARYFTPVNVVSDLSRLPKLLTGYNIPDKDISSYTEKCRQLNDTVAELINLSLHVEGIGIGQEFLAKIKNYMVQPRKTKPAVNHIDSKMLETMWKDIIDPLVYQIIGNFYYRSIARLDAAKSLFVML